MQRGLVWVVKLSSGGCRPRTACVGVSSGLEAVKMPHNEANGHHQHHINTAGTSTLISIFALWQGRDGGAGVPTQRSGQGFKTVLLQLVLLFGKFFFFSLCNNCKLLTGDP